MAGLAALIRDNIFSHERQNAISKYIEESKDIEKCWFEIAIVRQTDLWWYCAIKYFSNYVGETKCVKHILSLIRALSCTHLGILLCKNINEMDLGRILDNFPQMISSVHNIKVLLMNEPNKKLLWLLRNNKCTNAEQIDLWDHAIMTDPIYALYAPPSVQNNPETLKIIRTRMYDCGLRCLHEPFENVPIDILRAVVNVRTIEYYYVTSKELVLIADTVRVANDYTTDAFMQDELFIEKLNSGEVIPSTDLHWSLSVRKHKTKRYTNWCMPFWCQNERIRSKTFLLYPFTFKYLTMRTFNELYKFFNNDEKAIARNNLAVLCARNNYRKSMLAIYYRHFDVPIEEEYKQYAKYIGQYEIKNFANDKLAWYNPDICQRAIDIDKENIWHVRLSSDNSFYKKFFEENPDMLDREVKINSNLCEIICKLGISKLLVFNILNGLISIKNVNYHRYEAAHAAYKCADDRVKKIIVKYVVCDIHTPVHDARFYHDNIPHYLLKFELARCDTTKVFNMIKANIDNLLFT